MSLDTSLDTMIVPKLAFDPPPERRPIRRPHRPMPRQFAPVRSQRWPWLVALGVVAAVAAVQPLDPIAQARQHHEARALIDTLPR